MEQVACPKKIDVIKIFCAPMAYESKRCQMDHDIGLAHLDNFLQGFAVTQIGLIVGLASKRRPSDINHRSAKRDDLAT
ncbi:hypothetical protein PK69_15000 [Xanthomonas phaseoli pv. phaseoli]|uniref:Uncharacterized protein n=1 Tax=Xanthomonas campestris pv. phaseoli TaxID=317013 RepID=A0AB34QKV6_XANCH|nr:hypothetical protein AC609_18345 [Xanthomonas phaseoli pv. phaseoli]AZU31705.1 hypothetical protein AC801_18045 [Xanthomonas sp. ISO98C4]AZU27367.1 hypothetical protein AC611_18365 [Xanthomonas phaseoli pv. phaseoli]AZU36132.1 hypothetical protein AC610_18335 [Xanthomonas phaseoli pv. phaseoli]KGT49027.1 hypothetical protein NZ02_21965 [Xanthomonas phaseoli pv. phaseoli]